MSELYGTDTRDAKAGCEPVLVNLPKLVGRKRKIINADHTETSVLVSIFIGKFGQKAPRAVAFVEKYMSYLNAFG